MTKWLAQIGRFATPAAMVVFLTYEISRSIEAPGWWIHAVVFGAAATAVGIEVIGILTGKTLEGYWRRGDTWRSLVSLCLLVVYTVGAFYILRQNPTLQPIPFIAAVVYVVAAMSEALEQQDEQERVQEQDNTEWQRLQDERREQRDHELAMARVKTNAAVRMEKARAKVSPKVSGNNQASFTHWRTIPDSVKAQLAEMSPEEIHERNPEITFRTAQNWHENARELAEKVSANGQG